MDTIVGKQQQQAVVSIVERFSKEKVLKKVSTKHTAGGALAIITALSSHADKVLTVTSDNGSEFAQHQRISEALQADYYFAHPYASWERGLNENTNGLVRQYLKKGSDFSGVNDQKLKQIMTKLNHRPRKSLGYATPHEVFTGQVDVSMVKNDVAVALAS